MLKGQTHNESSLCVDAFGKHLRAEYSRTQFGVSKKVFMTPKVLGQGKRAEETAVIYALRAGINDPEILPATRPLASAKDGIASLTNSVVGQGVVHDRDRFRSGLGDEENVVPPVSNGSDENAAGGPLLPV